MTRSLPNNEEYYLGCSDRSYFEEPELEEFDYNRIPFISKLKSALMWALAIGGSIVGLFILGVATNGRFFNFLLYISLLGASTFIVFILPVLITSKIADIYQSLDKDPNRGYWIGNAIRCMGLFEGMRGAMGQLHSHGYEAQHDRFHRGLPHRF